MAKQKINKSQIADQEAWTPVTFQNSWTNYGSGYDTAAYMKDSLGFVHIKGFIKSGTTSSSTPIFTLPVGYRPLNSSYNLVGRLADGSTGCIEIRHDTGAVQVVVANAT